MSRCFPYAPLSERNAGEPPIGSIKKEREHAEERKKRREEKKEKKHKKNKDQKARAGTSLQEHCIISGHGEQVHKKRKYDSKGDLPHQKNGDLKQAGKCRVEQLEGSGLSEEHGLPCFIPEPCESSESTQNSSKSRKLEAAGAAPRSHGSTILRFKLPPKKDNDPESIPSSALPDIKVVPLVPSSALPGPKLPLKKHKNPETVPASALPDVKVPLVPSSALPGPKLSSKKHKDTGPSKKHNDPGSVPPSALPSFKLPLKKHKDPEMVSSSALPDIKVPSVPSSASPGPKLLSKKLKDTETTPTSALPVRKCKVARVVPINVELCTENRVPEYAPCNEEPCFSGRTSEPSVQEASEAGRRHSSSRSSKKRRSAEETESQLRDLLSSLNPALLQCAVTSDDDDQAWLFGSSRKQHKDPCARKSCEPDSVAEGLVCGSSAGLSYQPKACFMPEFDCYQLSYVFPF